MKISILAINIALVLSVAIPIIWLIMLGIRNTKKTVKKLKNLSEEYNMPFTNEEIWNDNFIGINEPKKMLVFIQLSDSIPVYTEINLTEIVSCKTIETTKFFMEGKKRIPLLEKIDLEFTCLNDRETIRLNFFNVDINYNQDHELLRAKKWEAIINKINVNPVIIRRAG